MATGRTAGGGGDETSLSALGVLATWQSEIRVLCSDSKGSPAGRPEPSQV